MNILISACLLGVTCRYDAKSVEHKELRELMNQHNLIPVCPEQLGGLATPRDPAERINDRIMTCNKTDVTRQYTQGANEALRLAKLYGCTLAILKERSPSCGHGMIYDGTFSGTLTNGDGKTAQLLIENGITVIGESEITTFFDKHR